MHASVDTAHCNDFTMSYPVTPVRIGKAHQVVIPDYLAKTTIINDDGWLQRYGRHLQQQMDEEPSINRQRHSPSFATGHDVALIRPGQCHDIVQQLMRELAPNALGCCHLQQYLYEQLYKHGFDASLVRQASSKYSLQDLFYSDKFSAAPILPCTMTPLEAIYFGEHGEQLVPHIEHHGHRLERILEHLKVPRHALVQYFGQWKKSDEQREAYDRFQQTYLNKSKFNKLLAPVVAEATSGTCSSDSEKVPQCNNCHTEDITEFIPTVRFHGRSTRRRREVLCEGCGTHYLKYGTSQATMKDTKVVQKGIKDAAVQQPLLPRKPCGVCLDDIPIHNHHVQTADVVQCTVCNMCVHLSCIMISFSKPFICDGCRLSSKQDAPVCCLCGKVDAQVSTVVAFEGQVAHAVCIYACDAFLISIDSPLQYKAIVDTQDIACVVCHHTLGWKTCCLMKGCNKWFHPVCAVRIHATMTYHDRCIRYFCTEHMPPLLPLATHDPPHCRTQFRQARMKKCLHKLYRQRLIIPSRIPDIPPPHCVVRGDPKIKQQSLRQQALRKSSAHMKIPIFPQCAICTGTQHPPLLVHQAWHCIKCFTQPPLLDANYQ